MAKTTNHKYIDSRSLITNEIPNFTPTIDQREVLHNMAENGFNLSCDTITSRDFWRPDWTCCPICGALSFDGVITHLGDH